MAAHNLPQYTTPFVGRSAESLEIADRLNDPDCRLLTLVGPGGIGKTRLAVQLAVQCAEQFEDGAYFVPLQPVNSAEHMLSTIADAADFQFHPGDDPKQQLLDYLGKRMLLLILDNLEHLLDGVGLLSDILRHGPRVRILVTSRIRLNLLEEWVFEVRELKHPINESETNIEAYDAVALFLEHVRRVQAGRTLTLPQKPAVIRICKLVGGLPLGIELAAHWARALPFEDIAQELERNLDILETSMRNIEPRHRSMRMVFEPTWRRLSDDEREVFMRLSVFRGGFTRDAAEYVAGASLRTLTALVDRSLVRMGADGRYDLHELLRQYAWERLSEMPEELHDARVKHCRYFTVFLEQKEKDLEGRCQKEALEEIQREIDNVRAAWQWAVEHRREPEIAHAAHALWFFYDTRGWYAEGEQAFQRAAEVLGVNGPDEEKGAVLGKLLACYGGFCFSLNSVENARNLLEASLSILRRHHAHAETGFALLRLSEVILFFDGDLQAGQDFLGESLTIFQAVDDPWGTAYSLRWLGFAALYLGEYEQAQNLSRESLAICEETGDRLGRALALTVACLSALELGEYKSAKQISQEIWVLDEEIGLQWNLAEAVVMYGAAICGHGDYGEARAYLYKGLQAVCEIGFVPIILYGLLETTNWLIVRGSNLKALEILSFLLEYPVPPVKGRQSVNRLMIKLQDELPTDVTTSAIERGRSLTLDTVVETCLGMLQPESSFFQATPSLFDPLTARELEVLQLVAGGLTNQEIATQLVISVSTTKKHVSNIFSKLDVKSRTQAVVRARELNVIK